MDEDEPEKEDRFSITSTVEVWDDANGNRIVISGDPDDLGLVELRSLDEHGYVTNTISGSPEMMDAVVEGLIRYLKYSREYEKK